VGCSTSSCSAPLGSREGSVHAPRDFRAPRGREAVLGSVGRTCLAVQDSALGSAKTEIRHRMRSGESCCLQPERGFGVAAPRGWVGTAGRGKEALGSCGAALSSAAYLSFLEGLLGRLVASPQPCEGAVRREKHPAGERRGCGRHVRSSGLGSEFRARDPTKSLQSKGERHVQGTASAPAPGPTRAPCLLGETEARRGEPSLLPSSADARTQCQQTRQWHRVTQGWEAARRQRHPPARRQGTRVGLGLAQAPREAVWAGTGSWSIPQGITASPCPPAAGRGHGCHRPPHPEH